MTNTFVIAEAGVNHNGERDKAFQLIDIAAEAGVDAVKFQTFGAERLAALSAPKAGYQKDTTGSQESQLAMLRKLELPESCHHELQIYAQERGLKFLSSAFDIKSLHFLESLDLQLHKIPSGEITNGPLLWQFARTGKNLILSTGMATLGEIELALAIIAHGMTHSIEPDSLRAVWEHWSRPTAVDDVRKKVTLLHCTSRYPTPIRDVNLRAIDTLNASFGLPVGYSDHTEGLLIPIVAVALGATIIEKHFTIDQSLPGPDHKASLGPAELKLMVDRIRVIEDSLGDGRKYPQPQELEIRKAARQQIIAAEVIKAGAILKRADLTTARSGNGLTPSSLWDLIGTKASRSYSPGDVIFE